MKTMTSLEMEQVDGVVTFADGDTCRTADGAVWTWHDRSRMWITN